MRRIPPEMNERMNADPYYKVCARALDRGCEGRITREHTLIYAGRQISEYWAIIPLCAYHHAVDLHQDAGSLDKRRNVWIALNRASDDELRPYCKAVDYLRMREQLNTKYGPYSHPGYVTKRAVLQ